MKFINTLPNNPLFLQNIQAKVGRWKQEEFEAIQRKARETNDPLPPPEPIRCADVATGLGATGVAGVGLVFVPGAGQVAAVIGGVSSVGGLAADLASRAGWC